MGSFWFDLQTIVKSYGIFGVFLATFIEEVIAPIPSGLVLFSLGSLFFFQENFSLWLIFKIILLFALPASLGATLGALPFFLASYFIGKPFIDRFGRLIKISWQDIERIESFLHKSQREVLVLFSLRVFPVVPNTAINVFFGILRFHLLKFLIISFLGNLIRATLFALIAWQTSLYLPGMVEFFKKYERLGWVVALLTIVLIYLILQKRKSSRATN